MFDQFNKACTSITAKEFLGSLAILLCHNFPSLQSMVLSDCGLKSQDVSILAQACAKGRLPELRHLDLSENLKIQRQVKYLF